MTAQTLLHLDATQLLAWRWCKGALQLEASFSVDPAGFAAFDAWLQQRGNRSCALLADVAEEAFQAESMPYVRGKDRRALIKRKLAQVFHGSPLALCRSLGRDKAGRRDEHMLLLGLPNPDFFEPCLSRLRARQIPLSGLYTGALVADTLAHRLDFSAKRFLLVNMGRAGIRVSFFDAARLRFSHLKAYFGVDAESLAVACAAETAQIREYLHGQRLAARNERLPCLILAHPDHHGIFAAHCVNTPELEFLLRDLTAISHRLGLADAQEDSSADRLWLHLLAKYPPQEQFAPDSERHFHALQQGARGIIGVTVVLGTLGLLLAGFDAWRGYGLAEETARARRETSVLEARYRTRMANLPPLPMQADRLRAIATRYSLLEQRSTQPKEMFQVVSRALERFPDIELDRLEWALSTSESGETQGRAAAPSANSTSSANSASPPMYAVVNLLCALPLKSTEKQRVEMLDAFTAALREDASLNVSVLGRPQENSSVLRGSSEERPTTTPTFELRISRRL